MKKITKSDIKRAISDVPTFDRAAFAAIKGEKITGGGNVLTIPQESGAGPFTLVSVQSRKLDPRLQAVDVYVAAATDGVEYNMPASTSFVAKAKGANLSVGDTFAVWRDVDYTARKRQCASYAITIISRAGAVKKGRRG